MLEHKSKDVRPVLHFFHTTLDNMWTRLFKLSKDKNPKEGEDLGYEDGYESPLVSALTQKSKSLSLALRGRF